MYHLHVRLEKPKVLRALGGRFSVSSWQNPIPKCGSDASRLTCCIISVEGYFVVSALKRNLRTDRQCGFYFLLGLSPELIFNKVSTVRQFIASCRQDQQPIRLIG